MDVQRIVKKVRMSKQDLVQYQILTELFMKKISLNQSDIELLTLLGLWGSLGLTEFCEKAADIVYKDTPRVMARIQNVRNRLVILERKGLVVKESATKKKKIISLSDTISVLVTGDILLDYNMLSVDSN